MSGVDERRFLRTAFGQGSECFALERLAAFESGELPREEAALVRQHVDQCPRCGVEVGLARAFREGVAVPGEAADVAWVEGRLAAIARPPAQQPGPGFWARIRASFAFAPRGLAVAAAALFVVAGGAYMQYRDSAGRPRFHDGAEVMRSAEVALAGPAGELTEAPAEFRWSPVSGAAGYRLRLLSVDGAELWTGSVPESRAAAPAGLIRAGSAYAWDVNALDGGGRTIARSPLQKFHILANTR